MGSFPFSFNWIFFRRKIIVVPLEQIATAYMENNRKRISFLLFQDTPVSEGSIQVPVRKVMVTS